MACRLLSVPEYATFERLGEALDACFRETVASAAKDASDFGLYTLAEDVEDEERSVSVREGAKQKHWPSGCLRPARHEPRRVARPWIRSPPTAPRPPHERRERPRTLCTSAGRDRARRLRGGRRRRRVAKRSSRRRVRLRSSDASLAESLDLGDRPTALETFVSAAVDGFFDNDLFHATRLFMANARGSFGLGVTCSLDSSRQMIVAARGQTNSVALYPRLGLVLYGSEQAAVKACVGMKPPPGSAQKYSPAAGDEDPGPGMRIDLDDLGGEIMLLDWGKTKLQLSHKERRSCTATSDGRPTHDRERDGGGQAVLVEDS